MSPGEIAVGLSLLLCGIAALLGFLHLVAHLSVNPREVEHRWEDPT